MTDSWALASHRDTPSEVFVKGLRQQWTNLLTLDPPLALIAAWNQQLGLHSYGAAIALVSRVIVAQSCMVSWISTIYLAGPTRNQDAVTFPPRVGDMSPLPKASRDPFCVRVPSAPFLHGAAPVPEIRRVRNESRPVWILSRRSGGAQLALPQLRPEESVF